MYRLNFLKLKWVYQTDCIRTSPRAQSLDEKFFFSSSFLAPRVVPQSSAIRPFPASPLVGFRDQTDYRAPAVLPVHLTGPDSSHTGPIHTPSFLGLISLLSLASTRHSKALWSSLVCVASPAGCYIPCVRKCADKPADVRRQISRKEV